MPSKNLPSSDEEQYDDTVNPWSFEGLTQRLYDYVDVLPSKKRRILSGVWFLVAAVFMVAASVPLPLPEYLFIISPIVGLPAGVILFAIVLSFIRVTRVRDWTIVQLKEWAVPQKRVTYVIITAIIVAAILIMFSSWGLPQGVGGAITVAVALGGYNVIRRTPYELELAAKGIPDPREFAEEYDEYDEDESEYADSIENEDNGPRRFR